MGKYERSRQIKIRKIKFSYIIIFNILRRVTRTFIPRAIIVPKIYNVCEYMMQDSELPCSLLYYSFLYIFIVNQCHKEGTFIQGS